MPKKKISPKDKLFVAVRANFHCEYCKCPKSYVPVPFCTDHIIPQSQGGTSLLSNLAYACDACNGHKYQKTTAIDPVSGKAVGLFHPRENLWKDHFEWTDDFLKMNGKTATGHATIETLNLNREALVNLRRMLKHFGKHPPEK